MLIIRPHRLGSGGGVGPCLFQGWVPPRSSLKARRQTVFDGAAMTKTREGREWEVRHRKSKPAQGGTRNLFKRGVRDRETGLPEPLDFTGVAVWACILHRPRRCSDEKVGCGSILESSPLSPPGDLVSVLWENLPLSMLHDGGTTPYDVLQSTEYTCACCTGYRHSPAALLIATGCCPPACHLRYICWC